MNGPFDPTDAATRRNASAKTGDRLLEHGQRLFLERGPSTPVSVRISDVVRDAGHTTGAAYQVWRNQSEFQHELAYRMLAEPSVDLAGLLRGAVDEAVAAGAQFGPLIGSLASAYLEALRSTPEYVGRLHLMASAAHDEQISALLARATERDHHGVEPVVARLLAHCRLTVAEPFDIGHVTTVLMSTVEGFAVRHLRGDRRSSAEFVFDVEGIEQTWSLLACALEALIVGFTAPSP